MLQFIIAPLQKVQAHDDGIGFAAAYPEAMNRTHADDGTCGVVGDGDGPGDGDGAGDGDGDGAGDGVGVGVGVGVGDGFGFGVGVGVPFVRFRT